MTENAYRKVTQDEIEHERMESRLKYQLQYNTDMSLARQEGMETEAIAEITGLPAAEIEKL